MRRAAREVREAFERRGVKVVPLEIPVIRDENECVHCGACVSVCPTGTFRFEDWKVVADSVTYLEAGTHTVSLTVNDVDGASASTSQVSFNIADAPLTDTTSITVNGTVVLDSGVKPGESVVTDGQMRLVPGTLVDLKGEARGAAK